MGGCCQALHIDPLVVAYRAVHGTMPNGIASWLIAKGIVEALDDPAVIPNGLARACIFEITNGTIAWPDDATRIEVVLFAEEMACAIFPELAHVDGVHMAQIERIYLTALWPRQDK